MEPLLDESQVLKAASQQERIDDFFVYPPELRPDIPHDKFDSEIPVVDLTPVFELEKLTKELADLEEGQEGKTRSGLEEQIKALEAARANLQAKIGAACEEYGFFQIVNLGIPTHLLKQLTECCQHIFDLPLEEKTKVDGGFEPGYSSMTRIAPYSVVGKSHVWGEGLRYS